MSTQVFGFTRIRPFFEADDYPSEQADLEGDWTLSQALGSGSFRYRSRFSVRLDGTTDVANWHTWLSDHQGAHDTWLLKAVRAPLKTVTGETPAGTVGGGNKVFTLAKKYIDASSLVVYRDGSPTAAYTLTLNNSTPTITYTVAPTTSVGADYDFYYPVRFVPPIPAPEARNIAASIYLVPGLQVLSEGEGSHLV